MMSLDVICKWRPSVHIYTEKMAGRKMAGKKMEGRNRRKKNGSFNTYSQSYDRVGRNHGVSTPFNRMVGSVFTLKGGISSNLL